MVHHWPVYTQWLVMYTRKEMYTVYVKKVKIINVGFSDENRILIENLYVLKVI